LFTVSPTSFNFGSVVVGQASPSQSFTVTAENTERILVTISDVITGTNAAEFTITSDTCNGSTLEPGGTCIILVAFAPATPGAKSATLQITGKDGVEVEPQTTPVPLSGNGTTPSPTPPPTRGLGVQNFVTLNRDLK
jgi:hypothetical protein